jgi:hypothetical protein
MPAGGRSPIILRTLEARGVRAAGGQARSLRRTPRSSRPRVRPRNPVAALPHRGAVVAVTGGHGASLAAPPGCRHAPRAKARFPCRATGGPRGGGSWAGSRGPSAPRSRLPWWTTPKRVLPREPESSVHDPDRHRAWPLWSRRTAVALLVAVGPAFPSDPCKSRRRPKPPEVLRVSRRLAPATAGPGCRPPRWHPSESVRPGVAPCATAGSDGLR